MIKKFTLLINELFYAYKVFNILKNKYERYIKNAIKVLNKNKREELFIYLTNINNNKIKNFFVG